VIKQEYLKIVRRRGLFWTAIGLTLLVAVGMTVTSLIVHDANPSNYDGGRDLLAP
jgi:hypothetical protein